MNEMSYVGFRWQTAVCLCVTDVNECLCEPNHACVLNADCINTLASYQCQCPDGFEGTADTYCTGTLGTAH